MRVQDDLSLKPNNFSWNTLVDTFWVDNPVGVGFATADSNGYGKILRSSGLNSFLIKKQFSMMTRWAPTLFSSSRTSSKFSPAYHLAR